MVRDSWEVSQLSLPTIHILVLRLKFFQLSSKVCLTLNLKSLASLFGWTTTVTTNQWLQIKSPVLRSGSCSFIVFWILNNWACYQPADYIHLLYTSILKHLSNRGYKKGATHSEYHMWKACGWDKCQVWHKDSHPVKEHGRCTVNLLSLSSLATQLAQI